MVFQLPTTLNSLLGLQLYQCLHPQLPSKQRIRRKVQSGIRSKFMDDVGEIQATKKWKENIPSTIEGDPIPTDP